MTESHEIVAPAPAAEGPVDKKTGISESFEIEGESDNVLQGQTSDLPSALPSKARTIALVITLTGAAFLNTLTIQSVVIILPVIGKELNIPTARQQWIVSAYSLTFGCFLLLWGRLADVYGKRAIFIYGTLWVAILTLVNPFVTKSEIAFDLLRGLQGIGGAANVPTAIGILSTTFPPSKARNYALSCYAAGAPMGSVMGNLLGGLLAQYASWQWVFWTLSIMAFVVTAAGYFIIPSTPPTLPSGSSKNTVDVFGAFLITIGVLVLIFALTEGNVVGWSKPYIPVLIVLAILFIVGFVFWQLHLEKRTDRRPLMKVTMLKNTKLAAAILAMAFFFSAFNNYLIFSTYFYQEYLGLDAIETTLRFIPTGVVGICTVFVTSHIIAHVPVNYILLWGTACVGISVLLMAVPISPHETYWAYGFPAMCLSVFGADTVYPSLTLFVAASLPKEDQALGGGLLNAVGQTGRAIGLAIGTAIQVAVQSSHENSDAATKKTSDVGNHAYLQGLRAAQWLNVGLATTGFIIVMVAFRGVGIIGGIKK